MIVERVGEAPPNGGLNQLGQSWGLGNAAGNGPVPTTTTTEDTGAFSWAREIFSTAKEVIPAVFQYRTQEQIMDMNIERARQGLPPIDPGVVAPQVRHIVDVPPEYRPVVQQAGQTMNLILIGGLALGAVLLLRMLR